MTDVLTEKNQLGNGGYGKFYSGFSQDDKQTIKNKIGNIPNNVGIKEYKITPANLSSDVAETQNIIENLAFIYIAPYISSYTDLKTPMYNGSISLSGMISNKINITQKMPGISVESLVNSMNLPNFALYTIGDKAKGQIEQKLKSIGVFWSDAHEDNYFIDNNVAKEFKTYIENNPDLIDKNGWINNSYDFDLSRNASLFDFGGFNVDDYTSPAVQLLELKNKLEKFENNSVIKRVILAIRNMIYDS